MDRLERDKAVDRETSPVWKWWNGSWGTREKETNSGDSKNLVAQSRPLLWDPMDCSIWSGPPVHGILQARILDPFPSPGDLPDPEIKPRSPAFQGDSLPSEPPGKPLTNWEQKTKGEDLNKSWVSDSDRQLACLYGSWWGSPWWLSGKEMLGSIPGSGKSPGGENGNPFQSSCQGNPMDRGDWWVTVHGVTKESETT